MKKILLSMLLILQIFLVTSCKEINNSIVSSVSLKDGITIDNFSIDVPKDYEETSSQYIDKYFVKDSSASIIVTQDVNGSQYNDINQYYQNTVIQYQNTFDEFTETSVQDVTVGIYHAKLSEFTYKIVSDTQTVEMSCYVEYILASNYIYIVTCSAPTSSYQSYREDFVQSVNSVNIKS